MRDYEIPMGERGIYNTKNRLNDLTGREWTFFTASVMETDFSKHGDEYRLWKYLMNSIIKTKYPTSGPGSISHDLRKIHPSPKPPQLMRDIIRFFTKPGGWVLDPFMGVGSTLIGASLLGDRNAAGIDIEERYIEVYREVCRRNSLREQIAINLDSREMLSSDELKGRTFDLILTDPPYFDMLSRKRTGGDRSPKGRFTSDPRDLGNMDHDVFLEHLGDIIQKSLSFLKDRGYVVLFCKDLQPTARHHNLLHADMVEEMIRIQHLYFRGYKIWYDKTINLYPYGYPFSYVSHQLHQFILIFQKRME